MCSNESLRFPYKRRKDISLVFEAITMPNIKGCVTAKTTLTFNTERTMIRNCRCRFEVVKILKVGDNVVKTTRNKSGLFPNFSFLIRAKKH